MKYADKQSRKNKNGSLFHQEGPISGLAMLTTGGFFDQIRYIVGKGRVLVVGIIGPLLLIRGSNRPDQKA